MMKSIVKENCFKFFLQDLKELGISFHMLMGDPSTTVPNFISSHNIGGAVADFSPMREARNWLDKVVQTVPKDVPVFQVYQFLSFKDLCTSIIIIIFMIY